MSEYRSLTIKYRGCWLCGWSSWSG